MFLIGQMPNSPEVGLRMKMLDTRKNRVFGGYLQTHRRRMSRTEIEKLKEIIMKEYGSGFYAEEQARRLLKRC